MDNNSDPSHIRDPPSVRLKPLFSPWSDCIALTASFFLRWTPLFKLRLTLTGILKSIKTHKPTSKLWFLDAN